MDKSIIHKLVLFIAAMSTTVSMSAYDFDVDGIYYDKISDTSVEMTHDGNYYDDNGAGYSGNVIIPETIEINGITYFVCGIGESAFYDCTGLTSITIPGSVTSIGDYAFSGCTGLTSVTISTSVTTIGDGAFSRCTGLTSVVIPEEVTSIGKNVFNGCSGLTSVTIPEGVISIDKYAFYDCTSLTSIAIPASVTSIGEGVFSGCSGLTEIVINENSPNYASSDGVLFNKTYTELILCPAGKAGIYNIPHGVTSICRYAFRSCTGLTSVTVPASVTSFGDFVFLGCTGLTEIIINENNPKYASIDGVWFNKTYSELILCPAGKAGIYNIPQGVTSICRSAFSGCTGLTSVNIPDGVASIGDGAFSRCIGLTSVTIPASVTSIGYFAFRGCLALNKVIFFAETVPTFGYSVFTEVPTTCSIYVPSGTRGSYASADELASYTIKEFGLTVTPAEVKLEVGATAELTASYTVDGTLENEKEISSVLGTEFSWSSSAENVAIVSTTGQITARNAGTAEIKAATHYGNTVFATSTVNVGASGILDVSADGIKISAIPGKIMVENIDKNQKVSAYTTNGICQIFQVSKDCTVEIPGETGKIYIIVVDGFATKVLAK